MDSVKTWPQSIKVSGFPFMLQGWNNTYYQLDEFKNGKPVYRLYPYTLYYLVDIIGVDIYFDLERGWCIKRHTDDHPLFRTDSRNLLGTWYINNMTLHIK